MRVSFIISFFFFLVSTAFGQTTEPTIKNNELAFGFRTFTYGLGVDIRYKRNFGSWKGSFYADLSTQRNKREQKIQSTFVKEGGDKYTWDKKNHLFRSSFLFGAEKGFIKMSSHSKVALGGFARVGPILGMLKPYYIKVVVPQGQKLVTEEVKYDASKYTYDDIFSQGDLTRGFKEIKLNMGIATQLGLDIEFSRETPFLSGLELCIFAEYYFKEIEIFDLMPNKNIFIGTGISCYIGGNW